MSLRAKIAESETEYHYKVYSTYNIHSATSIAMIRVGLAGRMVRDITPGGIIPYAGTKTDRFPSVAMKPTYVVELITGLPLRLKRAVQELSLALNVAQDLIQVEGEEADPSEAPKTEKPYQADGVTPGFLSKDINADKANPVVALKDLLGDLTSGKGEHNPVREVKPVYEGFSITQIEAEMLLGEDLRRGYYVVRGLGEQGRVGISGPHMEIPVNYPLDLDRVRELQVEAQNSVSRQEGLVEFDLSLIGRVPLNELQYSRSNLTTVKVQDTDTMKEYPVLVTVQPGMGDDEIRNAAVQEVSQRFQIDTSRLIALDPNRPKQAAPAQQVAA